MVNFHGLAFSQGRTIKLKRVGKGNAYIIVVQRLCQL